MAGRKTDNNTVSTGEEKAAQRKQYFFVIKELTSREIKRKYSRSYLGIIWSVLNPLLMMGLLSMIFSQLFKRSIENYPIYYLTGYILWQMFTGATNALVNLGYSLIAYIVMLFIFGIRLNWMMLFSPVIVLLLLMFSLGIAFVLSSAYVFFGDVKHLYSVVLTLWMYCSAIFYPVDQMHGVIRSVIELNPIFNYIDALRNVVIYGVLPPAWEIVRMVVWAAVVYTIGFFIFRKNKNKVMQKI